MRDVRMIWDNRASVVFGRPLLPRPGDYHFLGDSVPFTPWAGSTAARFNRVPVRLQPRFLGVPVGNLRVFQPATTNACWGCGTMRAFRFEALISTKRLMDAGMSKDEALEYFPLCLACC